MNNCVVTRDSIIKKGIKYFRKIGGSPPEVVVEDINRHLDIEDFLPLSKEEINKILSELDKVVTG